MRRHQGRNARHKVHGTKARSSINKLQSYFSEPKYCFMTSAGFVDTLQSGVLKIDLQGGKLLLQMCGTYPDASVFSLKSGGRALPTSPELFSRFNHTQEVLNVFFSYACDWGEQNHLGRKGTSRSPLPATPQRHTEEELWLWAQLQAAVMLLCRHCNAAAGVPLPLPIVYFEHISVVLWVNIFFSFSSSTVPVIAFSSF